jgi:hypothetical protein
MRRLTQKDQLQGGRENNQGSMMKELAKALEASQGFSHSIVRTALSRHLGH